MKAIEYNQVRKTFNILESRLIFSEYFYLGDLSQATPLTWCFVRSFIWRVYYTNRPQLNYCMFIQICPIAFVFSNLL